MANCKAGHTCRFVATEEVFQQIDTTTVEMTTQVNYFNESYDYTKDFEASKAYTVSVILYTLKFIGYTGPIRSLLKIKVLQVNRARLGSMLGICCNYRLSWFES